jgi:hypothetical protein
MSSAGGLRQPHAFARDHASDIAVDGDAAVDIVWKRGPALFFVEEKNSPCPPAAGRVDSARNHGSMMFCHVSRLFIDAKGRYQGRTIP